MTPTNDKVDQSGADERLLKIADWLGSQVSMGQNSPDEPPDYCSQFDYEAAQCSAEIRSIAGEIASASPALQAQIAQAVAVPNGYKLVPIEPTKEMLHAIVCMEWPEDSNAGKEAQRILGPSVIPYVSEFECAYGQYRRILNAAPQQAVAASSEPVDVDDVRNQAGKLSAILREMVEGSDAEEGVDIYADDFRPADGDVFIVRAAHILDLVAQGGVSDADRKDVEEFQNYLRKASTNQPVQAKALTDERAAFEAAYAKLCCVPDTPDEDLMIWAKQTARFELTTGMNWRHSRDEIGEYRDSTVQRSWEIWQARALLASQPSAQADVAAVRDAALEEAAHLIETTRETTMVVGGGETERHLTARKVPDHDLTGRTWAKGIRALKSATPADKGNAPAEAVKP